MKTERDRKRNRTDIVNRTIVSNIQIDPDSSSFAEVKQIIRIECNTRKRPENT